MNNLLNFFASGIFYVFGLNENPLIKIRTKYHESDDAKNIQKDWNHVGESIKQAYAREKQYPSKAAARRIKASGRIDQATTKPGKNYC